MEVLKAQREPRSFLDKPLILLNNIVQVFLLADLKPFIFRKVFIKGIKSGFVAAAVINSDFVRLTIFLESLSKESFSGYSIMPGPQQKVNRVAKLVNGSVQINPFTVELNVRLVHPPASINQVSYVGGHACQ